MPPKRKVAKAPTKRTVAPTSAPARGRRKVLDQDDPVSDSDAQSNNTNDLDEDDRPGPAKRKRMTDKPARARPTGNGKAKAVNGLGARSQYEADPIDEEHPVTIAPDLSDGTGQQTAAVNLVADWGPVFPHIRASDGFQAATLDMDVDDDSVPPTAPTDLLLHQADLPCSILLHIPPTSLDKSGCYIGSPLATLHEFTCIELEPVTVITRHAFSLLGYQAHYPPPIARLPSNAPSSSYSSVPTNQSREYLIYRLPNPETKSWGTTVDEVLATDPEIFSRIVQKDNRSQLPLTRRIVCATRWVLPVVEDASKGKAIKGKAKAKAIVAEETQSIFIDPTVARSNPTDAWPLFTGVTPDMMPYLRVVLRPIPGASYASAVKDAQYMYRWTVYLRTDAVSTALGQPDPAQLATIREMLGLFPQAFQPDLQLVDQARRLLAPVPIPSIDVSLSPPQALPTVIQALSNHPHVPLLPAQERMLHWLLERELEPDSRLVHTYRYSSAADPLEATISHASSPTPTVYQLGPRGAFYCPTTCQITHSASDPSSIATTPEHVPYHSLTSIVAQQGDTRGLISVLLALIQSNPSVFPASMDMLPADRGHWSIHTRATLVLAPALLIAHWHAVLGSHASLRSLRTHVIGAFSPDGRFFVDTVGDIESLDIVFATIDGDGLVSSDEVRGNRLRLNGLVSLSDVQWHRVIVPVDAYLPAEKVHMHGGWHTVGMPELPFLARVKADTSVVVTVALAPPVVPADVADGAVIEPTRAMHALADPALCVDAHLDALIDGPLANRKGLMTLCANLSLARIVLGSAMLALPAPDLPMFTYTNGDQDAAEEAADMVPAIEYVTVPVYESVAMTLARTFLCSLESRSWSRMTGVAGTHHLSLSVQTLAHGEISATMDRSAVLPEAGPLENALGAYPATVDFDQEWALCKVFDVGLAHWLVTTVDRQMISSDTWGQVNKPMIQLCSSVLRIFSTKHVFKSQQSQVQRMLTRLGMPVDLIVDVFGDLSEEDGGANALAVGDEHGICYELEESVPSTYRTRAKEAGVSSSGYSGGPHVMIHVLMRAAKLHASRAAALRYVDQIKTAAKLIKNEYVLEGDDNADTSVKCGECGMDAALAEDRYSVFACGGILCGECVDAHDCSVGKCARKFEYPITQGQPAHVYPVGFQHTLARWKAFVASSAKFDDTTPFGALIPRFPIPFFSFIGSKLAQFAMYISSLATHSTDARFLVLASSPTTRQLVTELLNACTVRTVHVDSVNKPESVFALDLDKSVRAIVMDVEECASAGIPQVLANHVVFLETLGSAADVNDLFCSDPYGEPFVRHSASGVELDVMAARLKEVEQRCIGTVYCAGQTQPVSVVRFLVRGSAEEEFAQRMWNTIGQQNVG